MSVWKKLLWIGVAALGTWAVAVLALSRGEQISALWIVIAGFCALSISYRFYSKWLATKVLVLNEERATPAVLRNDNKDYVPTNRWMVFGHHFAAIAGPGPLVGPVLAAQFGFLPGTLWILIGATLGGGVHDMIVLFASIRRGGKTLGQMVKEEIGRGVGLLALVSVLAIMIILLAVLALVVVQALAQSPWGVFTIAVTIPIALIMGIALRTGKVSVLAVTIFGLLGLAFGVWGGQFLGHFPAIEAWFHQDQKWLAWAIMIYGLAASILPVWMLLTPRDYLSTFLKLGTVALLAVAVVLINPTLQMPAITKFIDGSGLVFAGPVFPFVCITIACGAVSGFSLAHCFGHDAENDQARVAHPQHRLRRDGNGNDGRFNGDDRGVRVGTRRIFRNQYKRNAYRSCRKSFGSRVSSDRTRNADPRHESWRVHDVQPRRWRANICCRHGAHVCSGFSQTFCTGALVSLRHHVRGAVHSDDNRCRNTGRTISTSGRLGPGVASARQHAFVERKLSSQLFAGRGMGLVFVSRRDRSSWRNQLTLAAVWHCQSIAVGNRALPWHDAFDQNAQSEIYLRHACSVRLHVCRHFLGWLPQSFFVRSETWFFEWRAITPGPGINSIRRS